MIGAVIDESLRTGALRMDAATLDVMNELRDFMFERVYNAPDQLVSNSRRSRSSATS
jgi:hypothetical protein